MSDSESSSSQSSQQQDNRNVLGQGAVQAQGGSSIVINSLDAQVANAAIQSSADVSIENLRQALSFGGKALTESFSFGRTSMDQSNQAQSRALDAVTQSADLVKDAYADAKGRGALTDKILIGAVAMAGIVAFTAIKGRTA